MDRFLIYGPPGAGKSTYARSLGVKVLEREAFPNDGRFRMAVRAANGPVAVVRCCFGPDELEEWKGLVEPDVVKKVDPGISECKRRLHARGHRGWRGEILGAERWYRSWSGGMKARADNEVRTTSRAW